MVNKQLHLDVAQLTDVGRKREHNEDNMAYVIPKDEQVMTRKGALFIVADGMGGHAAGEVASEIAVDSVSNIYYQDDNDDIAASLTQAIKRANASIYQRAAENMLRSGMGTTCVAAVLRGDVAYIANVGDSRAYLVRRGQVKQVSQDHSWVAEQVRAGVLTEEQARTHAQRNVITRCLGTQADVEIDVFPERVEEGDCIVLCSDGLSGLVSDDELRAIVAQFVPQESVYHLIERANEHGGPDNITAIVVRVQEVGPEERLPVRVGPSGAENDEDTLILGVQAGRAGAPKTFRVWPAENGEKRVSGSLPFPNSPLVPSPSQTVLQPDEQRPRSRQSRLFYPTLAVLVVVLMVALAGGGYYLFRNTVKKTFDPAFQQANKLITQADGEIATPVKALQDLAQAQSTLQNLLSTQLNQDQKQKVQTLLNGDLTTETKKAIASYNQLFGMSSLPCPATPPATINEGNTGTHVGNVATVQLQGIRGTMMTLLYSLGQDGKVYPMQQQPNKQYSLSTPLPFAGHPSPQVLLMTGDGPRLLLITALPQSGKASSYSLNVYTPQISGVLKQTSSTLINTTSPSQSDLKPSLLTAWGPDIYVVLTSPAAPNNAQILHYMADVTKKPSVLPISVSAGVISVAAFPNNQLFLLLSDGEVRSLQVVDGQTITPTPAFVQPPIAFPLSSTASQVVPIVTPVAQTGKSALSVPGASLLIAAGWKTTDAATHLYLLDSSNHRILDLKQLAATGTTPTVVPTGTSTTGTNMTFQVEQQYVSSSVVDPAKSFAADPLNPTVYLLTQGAQMAPTLLSINVSLPSACASAQTAS